MCVCGRMHRGTSTETNKEKEQTKKKSENKVWKVKETGGRTIYFTDSVFQTVVKHRNHFADTLRPDKDIPNSEPWIVRRRVACRKAEARA